MKIASVADVKARFSNYLKESEEGLVIVTRNGRAVAALVAVHDDEELERLIWAHSLRLRALLEASRKQIQEGAGMRHEDFWREMEAEPNSVGREKGRRKSAKPAL